MDKVCRHSIWSSWPVSSVLYARLNKAEASSTRSWIVSSATTPRQDSALYKEQETTSVIAALEALNPEPWLPKGDPCILLGILQWGISNTFFILVWTFNIGECRLLSSLFVDKRTWSLQLLLTHESEKFLANHSLEVFRWTVSMQVQNLRQFPWFKTFVSAIDKTQFDNT